MIEHSIFVRVPYADTDPMGFVHHANYVRYFENGRAELFRKFGLNYKDMEDNGIQMPVLTMHVKFLNPAFYDDMLTVKTFIREVPRVKVKFEYETYNQQGLLLNTAEVVLCFMKKETKKACLPPENVKKVISELYQK